MLIVCVFVLFIFGVWFLQYLLSLHTVTFSVSDNLVANVYKATDKEQQKSITKIVSGSSSFRYQTGSYCVKIGDKNYDTTPICFDIENKDITVTIAPNYSKVRLNELLDTEINTVQLAIKSAYKEVIGGFTIQRGALFGRGEWYGTTLTQKVAYKSEQAEVYRVLLKKDNDKWTTVGYPQLSLSKYKYPDTPVTILTSINKMLGDQN
jgi:hypothetical protein